MNYELALELKNAGFPQDARNGGIFLEPDGPKLQSEYPSEKAAYFPTLSELIVACGEEFESLDHFIEDYLCEWTCYAMTKRGGLFEEGETPEEAVANLWLSLNK